MLHHWHNDSVTSPNVVQQKIRIWVEGFVSQRFGNGMRASVDLSACGCCGQCAHMALGAANLVKQLGPFLDRSLFASFESRAGVLEARMKRAKWSTSSKPSGPALSLGSGALLQSLVTSSGNRRVVMPISFR